MSKQTTMFDAFPSPPMPRTDTDRITVDYTDLTLGTGVGHKKVITKCHLCGKNGVFKEAAPYNKYIHCEEIRLGPGSTPKRSTVSACIDKDS